MNANPNDPIREKMLRYFYDRAQNARSETGKHGYAVKISDLKADLKTLHGFTQQEVVSNLRYLIDRGWVNVRADVKQVPTKKGMLIPSETKYYEISAEGTDKIEGGSAFQPKERFSGININAVGGNTITLGDGNVVQAGYRELFTDLSDLRQRVVESDVLTDEQKFSAAVDIGAIQDQLAKPTLDRQVMRRLWEGVEKIAVVAGLADAATNIAKAIDVIG